MPASCATADTVAARCFALVPCAGIGARAGGALPKQYQRIAGKPLVLHTLEALARTPGIVQTLVVTAPADTQLSALLQAEGLATSHAIDIAPCGGPSRAASVLGGLRQLLAQGAQAHDWVLVHDAARCLVEPSHISALIQACLPDAVGGLLALPVPDTLKAQQTLPSAGANAMPRAACTIDRSDKWLAQTPQMFRIGLLHEALTAHEAKAFAGITDEASAIEAAGHAPLLVLGSPLNFKITWPQDFALAHALLQTRHDLSC